MQGRSQETGRDVVRKAEGVTPCRRKKATANKDEPKMRTGRKTSKGDVKEVKTAERRKKTGPFAECPRRRHSVVTI